MTPITRYRDGGVRHHGLQCSVSEKPSAFLEMIEAYFPSLPKIEPNARKRRPNWDGWGNEIECEGGVAAE